MTLPAAALFIAIAVAGYALVAAWKPLARRWRLIDIPNARSSHTTPTLRAGGVPLVLLTLATLLLAAVTREAVVLAVTSAIIAITGFIDDIRSLGWRIRFTIQIAMALAIVWAFGPIREVGPLSVGVFAIPLTVMWIAGLTNAYNFMDGIDGIAGSQAVVAAGGWAAVGILSGDHLLAVTGIAIAAASLGFLVHNWPPASIFMGDVASGFLGFMFAAMTVRAAQHSPWAAVAGALFVWPFLADTIFTFFRRLVNRENVVAAHRSHIYQRMVIAGASHARVTTLYALLALVGTILGALLLR